MTICVWKMHSDAGELLGRLRTHTGLEICVETSTVWIRCENASDALQQAFMKLPAIHFWAMQDGQLIERGTRLPRGYVAEGPWIPISQWMEVALPVAGLSGISPRPISIDTVRSEVLATPEVLQTDWPQWQQYVVTAPRIRIEQLAFAATADGMVFVRGAPLPPIPGKRFVVQGCIAVEAGWTWYPAIAVEILESALRINSGDMCVMYGNGSWQSISEDAFVQATRSSVRSAAEGFGHAI